MCPLGGALLRSTAYNNIIIIIIIIIRVQEMFWCTVRYDDECPKGVPSMSKSYNVGQPLVQSGLSERP